MFRLETFLNHGTTDFNYLFFFSPSLMKNIFESFGHYNFTTVEVESIYLAAICRNLKASEDG